MKYKQTWFRGQPVRRTLPLRAQPEVNYTNARPEKFQANRMLQYLKPLTPARTSGAKPARVDICGYEYS